MPTHFKPGIPPRILNHKLPNAVSQLSVDHMWRFEPISSKSDHWLEKHVHPKKLLFNIRVYGKTQLILTTITRKLKIVEHLKLSKNPWNFIKIYSLV